MLRAILIVLAINTLVGCVAVWGRAYQIGAETANSVTIKYDGHFTSSGNVDRVAQASCQKFGKAAAKQDESTSIWGLTTVVFTCHRPKLARPIG
jgi:hypothetical protein